MLPALKESDGPVRGLAHPRGAFCFDIFSQAARAIRDGGVLGPLPAASKHSAGSGPRVAPEADCDGYLIGSRTGFAAPLTGWDGRIRAEGPDGARVRTDGRAPVLTVRTESDLTGVLAGVTARQPDSSRFRWWEIAGADRRAARHFLPGAGELRAAAPLRGPGRDRAPGPVERAAGRRPQLAPS